MNRRHLLKASLSLAALAPPAVIGQGRHDTIVIGLTLEPTPGLDPTSGAASSIAEITLYNIYETLTKINPDGSVSPLLAERWEVSPDLRTYTFRLRRGVKFSNGEPFTAQTAVFAFRRAGAENSTNKDRRTFASMESVTAVDDHTLVIVNKELDPDFLFLMGQATAAMVEPKSADTNATRPVGTGPYVLENWVRGSSVTLARVEGHRNAASVRMRKAIFRFIADPAAQVAALLAGDVDAFPRVTARGVSQFQGNPKFQVLISTSRAKTILAMNNRRKPLDDVRVRRAIAMAIDRKAVIQGAADGYGAPIGSYYVPTALGYVDMTAMNAFNPERARALLKEAGIGGSIELTITLPPMPYARQGGEVIVSQLSKIGVHARLQNVEWAQWLSNVYGNKNYDMTIISHAEPFDLGNFARPGYYWNYESARFNDLYSKYKTTPRAADRARLLGDLQRLIADDSPHAFLYAPQWVTVAKRNIRGLWKDMPIFVNDLSAISLAGG